MFSLPATSPGLIETALYAAEPEIQRAIYLVFVTLLVVAPGLSILIMIWSKLVRNFKMETQQERSYALGIMTVYALFCYFYLRMMILGNLNYSYILIYMFALTLCISSAFILNFFTKISLHAMGIFGLVGALIGYFNNQMNVNILFILLLIIIAGLVSSSRLYLNAHKRSEILLGTGLGFAIQFLCMKFEWFI